jgi:hypothetical protein
MLKYRDKFFFTTFIFGLNSNQGFLQKFSNKIKANQKKERREKFYKRRKGRWLHISLVIKNSPRPVSHLPRTVFFFPLGR